jgi:hypothetical protein
MLKTQIFIERPKITNLKKKLIELAKEVNCECLPKIFQEGSHHVMKLIWTFLFLVFSGFTLFALTENLNDYFRHDF